MNEYPQHCDDCGAYLATATDQTKHAAWHLALTQTLTAIGQTAEHADAFHRLLRAGPK